MGFGQENMQKPETDSGKKKEKQVKLFKFVSFNVEEIYQRQS